MGLQVNDHEIVLSPGPLDVHTHPRVFDAITPDSFHDIGPAKEGKAGLRSYTEVALRSGIVAMLAMPNEAVRLYDPSEEEKTEVFQFPIATRDRLVAMQAAVSHEAVIPTGLIFGLDPERAIIGLDNPWVNREHLVEEFIAVKDECLALKIYGAETTGGNNINKQHIPDIAELWHEMSPEKPVIMHLEDEDVADVLEQIGRLPNGKEIPLHIAHISSRQELEAVIEAKKAGMNVTCEVTPHHLTFDQSLQDEIGSFGCMKPSLKTKADVEFIWGNIHSVDIFASDCAPHRLQDKEDTSKTTYGVTNHTVMLPTLLAAVDDGKISYADIYEKFCVTPRKRFNMPESDGSIVRVSLEPTSAHAQEERAGYVYGENPWLRTEHQRELIGRITVAGTGSSFYDAQYSNPGAYQERMQPSYKHLLRPKNWQQGSKDGIYRKNWTHRN